MRFVYIIMLLVLFSCSNASDKTKEIEPYEGWGKTPDQIVHHLNQWDKDEFDVIENPNKYPNRIPSGESNGWLHAHKEKLNKLNIKIKWDADKREYVITN